MFVLAVGCQVVDVSPGSPFQADTLTPDGTDRYALTGDRALAIVTAPITNAGGNTRVVFAAGSPPDATDHAVCATWIAAPRLSQPGLMARWDGTRGVSVTRNVWGGVATVFNVHWWDLNAPDRFTLLASFPLAGVGHPGPPAPLPWRACASATGPTFRFKVWPLSAPEPPDGDPCCGGTVNVSWFGPGRPGWYAGHLQPGDSLVATDLT